MTSLAGKGLRMLVLVLVMMIITNIVMGEYPHPSAPTAMENISSTAPLPSIGAVQNVSGGTINVVNINVTTQTPRWKAFVGNITGKLALQNSQNQSIYEWDIISIEGEIYATRYNGLINWDNIKCANQSNIDAEETALNITPTSPDSINNTFNETSHAEFYAGTVHISANSCRSTALYVNGQKQSAKFQEVLLHDGSNLIYTGLLENSEVGYNGERYDYQLIVAENGLEGSQPSTAYYFYLELI
ncbi:hypothetical protein D6745_02530 [Candidatus Woesearchaeota archaeon]|nr:MAG: hypothetical protein D6745_02530 [Candidatus Woesearchaeota archaeon]